MQTIVEVPAGTCLLIGTAGPILNAAPPATPTGVWGHGGAVQDYVIGQQRNGAGCSSAAQYPLFIPSGSYIEAQAIGAQALLYRPRAGGGNAGAVAGALDRGPYPAPFTPMDGLYNSLDLLNYGDPGALRAALVQLDGEVHASAQTVLLSDSIYLREAVLGRMRQAAFHGRQGGPMAALSVRRTRLGLRTNSPSRRHPSRIRPSPTPTNAGAGVSDQGRAGRAAATETRCLGQGIGAWGRLDGDGNAADVSRDLAGLFAGVDRRFAPNWLAGVAAGYTNSFLEHRRPQQLRRYQYRPSCGLCRGRLGPLEAARCRGGSFSSVDTSRDIAFPGFPTPRAPAMTRPRANLRRSGLRHGVWSDRHRTVSPGFAFVHLNIDGFSRKRRHRRRGAQRFGDQRRRRLFHARRARRRRSAAGNGMVLTLAPRPPGSMPSARLPPRRRLPSRATPLPSPFPGRRWRATPRFSRPGFDVHLRPRLTFGMFYFSELAGPRPGQLAERRYDWRF